LNPACVAGVKVVPICDRSDLILRSIDNLKSTLIEVLLTVSLIVLIFLWHLPSSIIPVITIPVAVLLPSFPSEWRGSRLTSCRSAASPSRLAHWWTPRSW
jgi:Cu(I)/Ag(I) efflux system membrane protein CusA/SilA